jgi:hypothetical protein
MTPITVTQKIMRAGEIITLGGCKTKSFSSDRFVQ